MSARLRGGGDIKLPEEVEGVEEMVGGAGTVSDAGSGAELIIRTTGKKRYHKRDEMKRREI